jgi:glycosyltransferase involved in cell wall biosynthesis
VLRTQPAPQRKPRSAEPGLYFEDGRWFADCADGKVLRILELETFGRGGLIHYAYNLSCALAERGHEVTLVTSAGYELDDRGHPPKLRLVKATGRFTRATAEWPSLAASLARKVEAIVDACLVAGLARRLRPDVVHLHSTNPIALAHVWLLGLLRVPVVVTAHVVTAHERTRFEDAVHRRIHAGSALIIAHSEFDRKRLLGESGVDPRRVAVIPHGEYGFFGRGRARVDRAEARQALGLGPRDEVALFFGYIREYKGLDLLLEAWPAVARARPAARLVVAGDPVRLDGHRRRELEAWAARVGAVHRFGYVPFSEVSRYFAAADVLVMPYRHVSQSGVLYLALSLGVPVLATRVGGLPEVLADGESALLVDPESPVALTEGLGRLLGDTGLRRRLARGGHRVADAHSWPSIAARTELVLARAADRRPQRDSS